MQVQAQAQYRHQQRGQQRQRLAQAQSAHVSAAFGIGQQFARGFGTATVHLFGTEHAFLLLAVQFGHALFIKRHVQRGTILFTLSATLTQYRDQQETQGNQEQQACRKPEINHGWFLSSSWSRR